MKFQGSKYLKPFQTIQIISALSCITLMFFFNNCSPGFEVASDLSAFEDLASNSGISTSNNLGKELYTKNCASCHGSFENSLKRDRSSNEIKAAISSVPQMAYLQLLSDSEIDYIAAAWTVVPPGTSNSRIYTCTQPNARGISKKLRRLSYKELKNTLVSLIGTDNVSKISTLDLFTKDDISFNIGGFQNNHNYQQVNAIFQISMEIAELLTSESNILASIAPSCLVTEFADNNISNSCLKTFIADFGRKLNRRSLSDARINEYAQEFSDTDARVADFSSQERLNLLIARLFQSPNLYFHIEMPTGAASNGRIQVDQWAVASRLSYALTGTIPDKTLLDAAAAGQLKSQVDLLTQANRLINNASASTHLRELAAYWLRLDSVASPDGSVIERFGFSSSGNDIIRIKDDIVNETKDYFEHLLINQRADFNELMTSDLSFPKTAELASILEVSPSNNAVRVRNSRKGIIGRPAVLLSNFERERPIHRGALVRERILCDVIPPPPADVDQLAADNLDTINPLDYSSRDIASITTQNNSCTACHSLINPIGFTLGAYGPLGELRSVESVYNNNQLYKQFPINTSGDKLNLLSTSESAANAEQLSSLLASSAKAKACIPKHFFELIEYREVSANDNCQMSDMESAIKSGKPIIEALVEGVIAEDIFWKGIQ